jgi:4-amino-4-deoxy-L-arabinose transferase-like glycosyltransferase
MIAERAGRGGPWLREWQVGCLVVLVGLAYFLRAGALPLRGEEPTRVQIAREMVGRGDWLVPRQMGRPFLIRPPLQNWLIALGCVTLGGWDAWTVRLSSLLATLAATLLVYGYSRVFLSRMGALTAAAAFATLADMFQMGRQAETEAPFIFLLSASLLLWHWGMVRRWPEACTWSAGYGFMALAMLTKGLQGPAYFVASAGVYLLWTRQCRLLLRRGHLAGLAVGAAVLAAWVLPYSAAMGGRAVWLAWFGDPATQLRRFDLGPFWAHLLRYPCEVAAGTMPWSLFLLMYLRRDFRAVLGDARRCALFMGVCLAVAFPTCWLHPGGQPRFFAPLFPCLSVLVGLAAQRCAEADLAGRLHACWRRYLVTVCCAMAVLGAAVLAAAAVCPRRPDLAYLAEPPAVALGYAAACAAGAAWLWRLRWAEGDGPAQTAVLVTAGLLALTFTGVFTDVRVRHSVDAAAEMRRLRERLPAGQHLVSLGHIDCLFPYYYGLPFLERHPWPAAAVRDDVTYFCIECPGDARPTLPFAWREVGTVNLDRNQHPVPERVVVVGQRLPAKALAHGK